MAYSYLLATDYGNGYYEGRHLELSCSQRYDIASNTSVVSWNLSSVGGSNGIIPCGPTTVTINNQVVYTKGRTTTNEFPAIVHPGVTGTVFVHHDRYGKAKIECKVSTEVGRTAADVQEYTGMWTLDRIPRESPVQASHGIAGHGININIAAYDENFNHTLTYEFYNASGTIVEHTNNKLIRWTIPTYFYFEMTHAKQGTGTIYCYSYDENNNQVGEPTSCVLEVGTDPYVCSPRLTWEITDAWGDLFINLTGDKHTIINGMSRPKINLSNFETSYGAERWYYAVEYGDMVTEWQNEVVHNTTLPDLKFRIYFEDTRGYVYDVDARPTRYISDYFVPLMETKVKNINGEGKAEVEYTIKGWNGNFGLADNEFKEIIIHAESFDGTDIKTYNISDLTPTRVSGNVMEIHRYITLTGLDYQKEGYEFYLTVRDCMWRSLGGEYRKKTKPIFDWGESDFNFNCDINVYENPLIDYLKPYLLDVVYPVGSIYMSIEDESPQETWGGTWEQIKDRFLLAAGNNHDAGDTGGEETHTLTINEMPEHGHKTLYYSSATGDYNWGYNYTNATKKGKFSVSEAEDNSGIGHTGGSQAHNNMPPYLTVYMWRRTA